MRLVLLLVLLCTTSGVAMAQDSLCQSIRKASDRLACYDKAAPPTAFEKQKPAAPNTPAAQQGNSVDQLAVENKTLNAKISNICRGC
jgi:hypothetical protein